MSTLDLTNDREIFRSLGADDCPCCGKAKKPRMSFCQPCYWKLPMKERRALYTQGVGYLKAFREAMAFLKPEENPS